MYIIIPYRNKKKDLDKMLKTFETLKKQWDIDITILICEQMDHYMFNKGLLINCGIHYLKKKGFDDTIIIHDVDIYPNINAKKLYEDSNNMCHLYGLDHCFGGIMLSNISNFVKTNGYSNKYIGWGREDRDFKRRCEYFEIPIDNSRLQLRYNSAYFKEEKHPNNRHSIKNIKYYNKCIENPKIYSQDGLCEIDNSFYDIEIKQEYVWLKVNNHNNKNKNKKTNRKLKLIIKKFNKLTKISKK